MQEFIFSQKGIHQIKGDNRVEGLDLVQIDQEVVFQVDL